MHMRNANLVKNDRGQTIIIFALIMPVLILFTGLALDAGLLYVTKAKLSTSVDAACLTGMKNLALTQPVAATLAADMFNANFGANPPIPTVTFPTDTYGDQQVKVTATASVNTLFMRYLSQWRTVPVSATAVSTRGKLIMSIVLDRSGSMITDEGQAALQAAVPEFVSNFDDATDEVAAISFSSNARIDFPIAYNFKTAITTAVSSMHFDGGTFGTGAGTQPLLDNAIGSPLSLAKSQNDSVVIQPNQNVIRVVVYFTDGLMNAVQDKIHCGGAGNPNLTLINYGGYDSGSGSTVSFLDPTCSPANSGGTSCTNESGHVSILDTASSGYPSGFKYDYPAGDICKNAAGAVVTTFTPQEGTCGSSKTPPPCSFTRDNVTTEAQYRAIQTGIALRTDAPVPTYVYTIGLSNGVTAGGKALLATIANDPDTTTWGGTFITTQPAGKFFYIPTCPGPDCTTQLRTAFQTIAAKILLRLTQ
jgi:Flp pilus assembly protein TadG